MSTVPASNLSDNEMAFLGLAETFVDRLYGQRFQDLWAVHESGFSQHGYFVEFGALNGRDFSNTYLLEQLGWSGIVAEPHPDYEAMLRASRNCFVSTDCVSDVGGETIDFKAVRGRPALSTMAAIDPDDLAEADGRRSEFVIHQVQTITLAGLLQSAGAPKDIDYLSIDTEGSELMILSAFDFTQYSIGCISVEHNFSPARKKLHTLLVNNGFVRKWTTTSGHDDWYVNSSYQPSGPGDPACLGTAEVSPHIDRRLAVLAQLLLESSKNEDAIRVANSLLAVDPDSSVGSFVKRALESSS